jgi:hypothetical protein
VQKIILLFIIIIALPFYLISQEGGYVNKTVAAPGENLDFYISTSESLFDIKIIKYEDKEYEIARYSGINGSLQPVRSNAYSDGANWEKTYTINIPDDWAPGAYAAVFKTSNRDSYVNFFVKDKVPGSYSRIIFIIGDNTWQAYNNFGGKSLYNYNSSEKKKSHKVSFERPLNQHYTSSKFYKHERLFIQWLHENNIKIEYTNQRDIHQNPELLERYDLIVIVGHSEYWSMDERIAIENHLNRGRNMIILGGNTSWWQIRLEDNYNSIICYKERYQDPLFGVIDSLVTSNWVSSPVRLPENLITGVSFYNGGFVNNFNTLPASEGYGDYAAYNTHHWIFNGTGLVEGEEFGFDAAIAGNEVDGAKFNWENGIPVVTGEDKTSLSFRILGMTPAHTNNPAVSEPYGTMGIWYGPNGSVIFNSSTINWVNGLSNDEHVMKITRNVFEKLITNKIPPEIVNWGPGVSSEVTINKKLHHIQSREYMVKKDESLEVFFEAVDYKNNPVSYKWFVNGEERGTGESFTFINNVTTSEQKRFDVTGVAYNQFDSSRISWKMFNSELAISSDPKNHVEPSADYNYKVRVFNHNNFPLNYKLLNAPDWLQMNSDGIISGVAPADTGEYDIEIEVSNLNNLKDTQAYRLYVSKSQPVPEMDITPREYALLQNYPNPFNPSTNISFVLPARSRVEIEIFNTLGEKITSILSQELDAGTHIIEWQPNVASGMYIYKLTAYSLTEPSLKYTDQKKMIFTK